MSSSAVKQQDDVANMMTYLPSAAHFAAAC